MDTGGLISALERTVLSDLDISGLIPEAEEEQKEEEEQDCKEQ